MSLPPRLSLDQLPEATTIDTSPSTDNLLLIRQGTVDKKMSANLLPGADSTADVSGPVSSDDNALARYDGLTGKIIQNSNALLDDAGNLSLSVALSEASGGTGENSYAVGDLLYASSIDTLSKLAAGSNTNVLTLTAGVPTWSPPASSRSGGISWTDQAVSFSALPGNGYFCTGALSVGLPSSAELVNGDTIIIYVDSASIVVVLANTGQFIQIGSDGSTSGGNATSSSEGSTLTLVYRIADTTWHTTSSIGTWALI